MRLIRFVLGRIILLVNWLTLPKGLERSEEAQRVVDEKLQDYRLYELTACPFCVRVRRECVRLSLPITRCNVSDPAVKAELEAGGGQFQVPCLRIARADDADEWLYESAEIVAYLRQQFLPQDMASSS
ncbi:MAG TPA: NrdH-redoxin [Gammaproteobacteria bacterium]|nr:NrdH-redoxin [Gammaproteobacteria bacterium]